MQCHEIRQETGTNHSQISAEILPQYVDHTGFVMDVRLLHPTQVSLEAFFPFPLLDCFLHSGHVCGQLNALAITEPDIVVRLALEQFHAFGLEGCV